MSKAEKDKKPAADKKKEGKDKSIDKKKDDKGKGYDIFWLTIDRNLNWGRSLFLRFR